jgi:S1-C subfamily serine protease
MICRFAFILLLTTHSFLNAADFIESPKLLSIIESNASRASYKQASLHSISIATQVLFFKENETITRGVGSEIYKDVANATVLIGTSTGSGSGAVVSKDGYILTNYHVIEESGIPAKEVNIYFKPDRPVLDTSNLYHTLGEVVKYDQTKDLALIRVKQMPSHAKVLALKRTYPEVGEDAHAVGHPVGEFWTYTRGYISQIRLDYKWRESREIPFFEATVLQTQTPINPGNSGGPLVNEEGLLIGLNSFGFPDAPGINFAIAAPELAKFMDSPTTSRSAADTPREPASDASDTCDDKPIDTNKMELDAYGPTTVETYDPGCDGKIIMKVFIPDDSNHPIFIVYNNFVDDQPEATMWLVDRDRDGQVDETYLDLDGDGQADESGINKAGEHVASELSPVSSG